MNKPIFENRLLEAAFREAVIENFERELETIDAGPDIEVSEKHKRCMVKLFKRERRKERNKFVVVWTKRFATVAAVAFILVSSVLLTVPEVRASIGSIFITWFEKFTKFEPGETEAPSAVWSPDYIPDGFTEIDRSQAAEISLTSYGDSDDNIIGFLYVPSDSSLSVNNENVEYGQVLYEGVVYHTFASASDDYESSVVWDAEGYRFSVNGYLPIDELLKIGQSVTKK